VFSGTDGNGDETHTVSATIFDDCRVSHFLSHTACLEYPLSPGNETVIDMATILGCALVRTTGQDLDAQERHETKPAATRRPPEHTLLPRRWRTCDRRETQVNPDGVRRCCTARLNRASSVSLSSSLRRIGAGLKNHQIA
jgi:hypothetical protein